MEAATWDIGLLAQSYICSNLRYVTRRAVEIRRTQSSVPHPFGCNNFYPSPHLTATGLETLDTRYFGSSECLSVWTIGSSLRMGCTARRGNLQFFYYTYAGLEDVAYVHEQQEGRKGAYQYRSIGHPSDDCNYPLRSDVTQQATESGLAS